MNHLSVVSLRLSKLVLMAVSKAGHSRYFPFILITILVTGVYIAGLTTRQTMPSPREEKWVGEGEQQPELKKKR